MVSIIIIYSLISFLLLFLCSKISYKLNFVDLPNKRKIHSNATAFTGGIIISVILLTSLKLFENYFYFYLNRNLNLIFSMAFLISLVGLIDDKFNLNAGGKLSLQIIPIFYLVVFENLALFNIGNYNYFIIELGAFVVPFTLISVLFLINSFNYFDGLDGTLSSICISIIIILFFLISDQNLKIFLLILVIPLIIFLLFNFSFLKLPKLFLGDNGSLLLGFIFSFFLIYLSNQNIVHPILLAWSIVIFVYEFLSINIIRLKNNKNPLKAGQDHIHHLIFKKCNSVSKTNLILILINLTFFIFGYLAFFIISELFSLILFIILFFIFLIFRNKYS